LFKKDLDKVKELIKAHFIVLDEEDTGNRLNEDQFGYRSFHYQIKLKPEWVQVPSLFGLGELSAEIQVRTVAQHIWAAASHELQYKKEAGVPNVIKRAIHRVSALLETVDLEFERVLDARQNYLETLNVTLEEQRLDVDLLAKYLDEKLPPENKAEDQSENYSELLSNLEHVGIKTVKQLSDLWEKHKEEVMKYDAKTAEQIAKNPKDVRYTDRVLKGYFFVHVGLMRQAITFEFRTTFGKEVLMDWKKFKNKGALEESED
jgi:putative GTP pyrophosphokinase